MDQVHLGSPWTRGQRNEPIPNPLRRLCRIFQHFPDGRREQGGRIERKSDESKTRKAEKSNPPLSSADVVDRPRRERSREIIWRVAGAPTSDALKKSGPSYLTIIPRPTSNTWYSKTIMGQHRIGQIMKSNFTPPLSLSLSLLLSLLLLLVALLHFA